MDLQALINQDLEQPCAEDRHTHPFTFIQEHTSKDMQPFAERLPYAFKDI